MGKIHLPLTPASENPSLRALQDDAQQVERVPSHSPDKNDSRAAGCSPFFLEQWAMPSNKEVDLSENKVQSVWR